jgi:hypothetical protein
MRNLYLIIFAIILALSCKKDNSPFKCKVTQLKVHSNGALAYSVRYFYIDDGKFEKIVSGTTNQVSSLTFEYFKDSIVTSDAVGRTTYFLNNLGLADSSKTHLKSNLNEESLESSYKYDVQGYLIEHKEIHIRSFDRSILRDTNFTYQTISDGNIIKRWGTSLQETHYEYLEKELINPTTSLSNSGYFLFLGKPNRNLLSKNTDGNGNIIYTYAYEFDSRGNVSKITTQPSAGNVGTLEYLYNCN